MNPAGEYTFFSTEETPPQQVFFGDGSRKQLGDLASKYGKKILLVSDPGVSSAGHSHSAKEILQKSGLEVFLFDQSIENPTESSVQDCVQVAKKENIDVIVGLGGGSSMDTAKGCNFILSNGGRMSDYWGVGKAKKGFLPFIAVPTTAGTGSECQSFALISHDESHKKMACGDKKALPLVTILDPELTISQPHSVSASTGVDALAHALESAVTVKRNKKSARHSQLAFNLIQENLPLVLKDPSNLEYRGNVLLGASHAGAAIEQSMLGAAHSMANPLTVSKGVVHGIAVSMALPEIIKFNASRREETNFQYAELARNSGIAEQGSADTHATQLLLERVCLILGQSGIPDSIATFGFTQEDIPSLASDAFEQWTAQFNPVPISQKDFEDLYFSILKKVPFKVAGESKLLA